ncbi:MAG: HD domain-containing protein [Acidobacteriota bacterium]
MDHLQKLLRAAHFAAEMHSGQNRKGGKREPYINHPLEVANLVANIGLVNDIDILMAALLHDTVEDCGVEAAEFTSKFGTRTCGIALEVTDDKDLPKKRRRDLQVEHAPHLSHGAKSEKLAYKISNCHELMDNAPTNWDTKRLSDYIQWGCYVVRGLGEANEPLEPIFDKVVARAEAKFNSRFVF